MSPYRLSAIEYRKSSKDLGRKHYTLNTSNVKARNLVLAQGHEADCVILDLVRDRVTDRLCVALTRARQAGTILMHSGMVRKLGEGPLEQVFLKCVTAGEYVWGPGAV
ncbi:hypothetical protein diail_4483 [Diaporthe ilicicola]|nr:hypothetical protein diail_4483 [Diaporthe ilicicola]